MANYDSNWHSTTTGEIFQTDGVVTTQKYYVGQTAYGASLVTFDKFPLIIPLQNIRAMWL